MRGCQGTRRYSWWKLLMLSVMMWKRYTADLSIDFSFIWMCQSSNALPPCDDSPQQILKRLLKNCAIFLFSWNMSNLMKGLIKMKWAAPEGLTYECAQATKNPTRLLPKDIWSPNSNEGQSYRKLRDQGADVCLCDRKYPAWRTFYHVSFTKRQTH